MKFKIIFAFILFLSHIGFSKNPEELGKINWLRKLTEAQKESKSQSKAILILFQEVPGCGTCKNYGNNVLSHPLIKELIETYFIPLCIYNNSSGEDKKTLDLFQEPSWNNPVVRIVNSDLRDLVKRVGNDYSSYGLISAITASMIKLRISIPEYVRILESEFKSKALGTKTATIGMYCFWSGEKTYGKLNGVVGTKAGFMGGSEVVQIEYCPAKISLNHLLREGKANKCADRIFSDEEINTDVEKKKISAFRVDKELKYYLHHSPYKSIPMTELQAMKANALLSEGKSVDFIFSPRQLEFLESSKNINNIGKNIFLAWKRE